MFTTISRESAARMSLIIGAVLALMTFTFPTFFFFSPFAAGFSILGVFQLVSIVGWFALVIVPPVLLATKLNFAGAIRALFFVSVIMWPAAMLLIRATLLIQTSNPYLGYLVQYPIFIFSDILVPIVYLVVWAKLRQTGRRVREENIAGMTAAGSTERQSAVVV